MNAEAPTFDPAAVTEELAPSLSKDRLRAVLRHYGIPEQPKAATKAELLTIALVAIRAAHPPALEAGPPGDPETVPAELEAPPAEVIPSASRFSQIVLMAEYLSKSNLVPDAYRGKAHDIGAVLLRANDLGIPLTSALENLYVIHGKVGMEAKLMRALARRDGHSITDDPASNAFEAIVHGRRSDPPYDEGTGRFNLDDAVRYELIRGYRFTDAGELVIDGHRDRPLWVRDPATMCQWRATARLCRTLFSDCLAGVAYTPDELGTIDVDEDGTIRPGRNGDATETLDDQRAKIAARVAELPETLRDELRGEWKRRRLPRPDKLTPAGIRAATQLLEPLEHRADVERAQAEAQIEDAELVEDDGPAQGGAEPGGEAGPAGDPDPVVETEPVLAGPSPPEDAVLAADGGVAGGGEPALYDPDDPERPFI